jgi:acetyl-CoA carboxylase biotin carboxyl carrier protein
MDLSEDEVLELLRLVRECDLEVLDIRTADFELHASTVVPSSEVGDAPRNPAVSADTSRTAPARRDTPVSLPEAPASDQAPARDASKPAHAGAREGLVTVKAPLLGIFYSAPEPGADPFTKEGAQVEEDTVIGLMEVMKSYSSVVAGVRGTVVEVVAENAALVEYGQPLLLVEPVVGG